MHRSCCGSSTDTLQVDVTNAAPVVSVIDKLNSKSGFAQTKGPALVDHLTEAVATYIKSYAENSAVSGYQG